MNDSSHAPILPSGGAGLNQRLVSSLEALSRASSCLIAVVGLAVLLGWQFDIELVRARLPGRTPVNSGNSARTAFSRLRALDVSPNEEQTRLCTDSLAGGERRFARHCAGRDHTHWLFHRS